MKLRPLLIEAVVVMGDGVRDDARSKPPHHTQHTTSPNDPPPTTPHNTSHPIAAKRTGWLVHKTHIELGGHAGADAREGLHQTDHKSLLAGIIPHGRGKRCSGHLTKWLVEEAG